jgi:hypothetical protein
MYPVTDDFLLALRFPHKLETTMELWNEGEYVQDLEFTDANLTVDDVDIRRKLSTTLTPNDEYVPDDKAPLIEVGHSEIKIYRGLSREAVPFGALEPELVPCGVFVVDDIRMDDSGGALNLQLDSYDRAIRIQRARLKRDYTILSGGTYADAIQDLLRSRWPDVQFEDRSNSDILSSRVFLEAQNDPWAKAQELAARIGCDLFFDQVGTCVLEVAPDADAVPVDHYVEGVDEYGRPKAKFSYINKRQSVEGMYNLVVATGESTSNTTPVRGEAADTDPDSLTNTTRYGEVPFFFTSSFISTVSQAQAAARRELAKVLGRREMLEIQAIVNPALDIGDVIEVQRTPSKLNALYIIDKITIPLVQDRAMNVSTRERKVFVGP